MRISHWIVPWAASPRTSCSSKSKVSGRGRTRVKFGRGSSGVNEPFQLSLAIALAVASQILRASETFTSPPPLAQEYIRELSELEVLRIDGQTELKRAGGNSNAQLSAFLYYGTRVQLALRADIAVLRGMQLASLPEKTASLLEGVERTDIIIFGRMNEIATKLLAGPQPGVDYGALVSQMPQLRAELDSNDQGYIHGSVLVFASLVDMRPDKLGHVSHLTITCAQRNELIRTLRSDFGTRLTAKNEDPDVSAAGVLWDYLHKGWKCSDQPW